MSKQGQTKEMISAVRSIDAIDPDEHRDEFCRECGLPHDWCDCPPEDVCPVCRFTLSFCSCR